MRNKAIISEKGAAFLRQGQMWMYRNNLERIEGEVNDGEIVDIETSKGEYLGTGFINTRSHIIVRILTKKRQMIINKDFFKERIREAIHYRFTALRDNRDNGRYVFGEADFLPGLTVDRYNDTLVTQITSLGMEIRKDMIYDALIEVFHEFQQDIQAIYERNDVKARGKEGLTIYKGFYLGEGQPTTTIIDENGLKLYVDFENGQKTGYFLDQKANRMLVRELAYGKKVCDCFTHTGGFALNAALGRAQDVTAVDVSASALAQASANARLNGLKIHFQQTDVFDYLDTLKKGQFDMIILDPPAFTKSRQAIDHAYKGYLQINTKAMKVLRGGGYLATCSCSRFMERENFERMLKEAAQRADVLLKQMSVTVQNMDHPILWSMSETSYLKFYIFQII